MSIAQASRLPHYPERSAAVYGSRPKAGTTPYLRPLARRRVKLRFAALCATHQSARARAGGLAATLGHYAGDDGGVVAVDLLHQAATTDRKVVMHLRRMQVQPVVVDHVDVGLEAGGDHAAIVKTDRERGLARLRRHHERDREFLAAGAVAGPVRQQIGREAGVADDAAMRAAVAQARHGAG